MEPNVPGTLFIFLTFAFFVVIAIGVALGAYAAIHMKKLEDKCK